MRKLLLSIPVAVSLFVFSAQAQNSQISDLAEQLEQNISDLADQSSKEFIGRSGNSRDELENLLAAQQLKATAEIFLLLVSNNRPNSELRDVADSLNNLARRFSSNNSQWQQIKRNIDEISRQLKGNSNNQDNKGDKNKGVIGKLLWHGTIDDEVHLIISGNLVQAKTISGTEYSDAIFSFTSPLPEENVQVFVKKNEGRGSAKVIQMPTRDNNFTAIIQILDKSGGAKEYDLEIYWTR